MHICEDMAQEVFTRVWQHRARYQPVAPVKSYLLGVAANVLRESQAKARVQATIDLGKMDISVDAGPYSPSSRMQSAEQLQAIRALMDSLSPLRRQAVELVYLAGLAPDEAAQRLGCSVQALRVHLCLARQKLRDLTSPSR